MTENKTPKPPRQSDELLKGVFEENFSDFLRFLYPNAAEIFDLSREIQFMDKELLKIVPYRERKKGKRVADLLAKVHLKDGSEKWLLVHTEIEGGSNNDFAFRIFQYHYGLLDRYGGPLETIVVFTGGKNQNRPTRYSQQCVDTEIHFLFRSYHIFDHSEEELLAMDNIFALIVLSCQKALLESKVPETELGEGRLTIAKALLKHNYDHDRIVSFLVFLKNFLYINDVDINRIFDDQVTQFAGGTINMGVIDVIKKHERLAGIQQGRQEGVQQGIQQGAERVVKNLILKLHLSDEQAARIAEVSIDLVHKVRAELKDR